MSVAVTELRRATGPPISPLRRSATTPPRSPSPANGALIWWKFRRHKVALAAGVVILLLYLVGIFCRVPRALRRPNASRPQYTYAPPQGIRSRHRRGWRLAVAAARQRLQDRRSTRWRCAAPSSSTTGKVIPIGFFVARPSATRLWGLFPTRPAPHRPARTGPSRCISWAPTGSAATCSRGSIYGTRVSMSIGLVGVAIEPDPRHRARRHLRLSTAAGSTRRSSA